MTYAHDPITPGEILLEEFLKPLKVSQYRLGTTIGVPTTRISEIVHGRRKITPDTALRLGRAFGNSARFWLNLQTRYDLEVEGSQHETELDRISPLANV